MMDEVQGHGFFVAGVWKSADRCGIHIKSGHVNAIHRQTESRESNILLAINLAFNFSPVVVIHPVIPNKCRIVHRRAITPVRLLNIDRISCQEGFLMCKCNDVWIYSKLEWSWRRTVGCSPLKVRSVGGGG